MQKLQSLIGSIFFATILASCGQSNVPPSVAQAELNLDTSTKSTLQERKDKDYDVPKPKKDWNEALEIFASEHPAFAGYDFSNDRKELIFYIAEKRKGQKITSDSEENQGRKLGHMRKEFLELIDNSTGFPEVTNGQGITINPRLLKTRTIKSSLSLADLNEYRKMLISLLYDRKANKLSIDFAQNQVNLQVNDETSRQIALDFLQNHSIPIENVVLTIGTVVNTKTVSDSFRPSVGGIEVIYGKPSGAAFYSCSLGLPILIDAVEGYLTASHCSVTEGVSNDGSALYQAGTIIGNKTLDNALYSCVNVGVSTRCQNADTSFYKSTVPLSRGRIIFSTGGIGSLLTATNANGDSYFDVTSVAERAGKGEILSSIGASGGYRTSTVVNSNLDIVDSETGIVKKGTVQVSNTTGFGAGCRGDSGGPWFQITGTMTAKFAGIAASADTPLVTRTLPSGQVQCYSNLFFSPVAQIRIAYPNRIFQFTR